VGDDTKTHTIPKHNMGVGDDSKTRGVALQSAQSAKMNFSRVSSIRENFDPHPSPRWKMYDCSPRVESLTAGLNFE